MDLSRFPLTIEFPRPFMVACAVSIAVHAGVAGWYRQDTATGRVHLPRPTLQVKVRGPRERVSLATRPAAPAQAVAQRVEARRTPTLVSQRAPAPVKTRKPPVEKPPAPNAPPETPPARDEPPARHATVPAPKAATVVEQGPVYSPPSSNSALLNNPKPDYPRIALRRGIEGLVLLYVDVDERGRPVEIQVRKSAGFKPLDIAALKAVRRWRFLPALRNGVAVRATVEVPIRFRLEQAGRNRS